MRIALAQLDTRPGEVASNLARVVSAAREASGLGAEVVCFHEMTLTDYVADAGALAEEVPGGACARVLEALARELGVVLSYGLIERAGDRVHIAQVFTGARGPIHVARKTWLYHDRADTGLRDEWARFDPGEGPRAFEVHGRRAACFICADGESPRCLARAAALRPSLVFYPNNRDALPSHEVFGARARAVGAILVVPNRVGASGPYTCRGGSAVYDAGGSLLASANAEGREEMPRVDL